MDMQEGKEVGSSDSREKYRRREGSRKAIDIQKIAMWDKLDMWEQQEKLVLETPFYTIY